MKSIHRAVAIATGVLMAATLAAPLAQAAPVEVTVQITQTTPRADGTVPFATTGPWASSSLKGLDGGPSSYSGRSGATATWIPDVPEAGEYRVEAAVPDTASSTTSATYTVVRPSGSTAVSIDQVARRKSWADLGTYAFEAGTGSSVRLTASGTGYTRAATLRLVPIEPNPSGLPFIGKYGGGMSQWTAMTGSLSDWTASNAAPRPFVSIDARSLSSGRFIRPSAAIELPESYRLETEVKVGAFAGLGSFTILADVGDTARVTSDNLGLLFKAPTATGLTHSVSRPYAGSTVCSGETTALIGEWFKLRVQRANGITATYVNNALVSSVESGALGGTFAIGTYHAQVSIGAVSVASLDAVPTDHPATAWGCGQPPETNPLELWYDEPAADWEKNSLPIGNGALGASIFGGVNREDLLFNEKTLWTGGPGSTGGYDFGNWRSPRPGALDEVRAKINAEKRVDPAWVAQKLGQPRTNFGAYQPFGTLSMTNTTEHTASKYRRWLDISDAVSGVRYEAGGVTYTREYFASAVDGVIVSRVTADKPGSLAFTVGVVTPSNRTKTISAANGRITMTGQLTNNGMRFESQVQVLNEGGTRVDNTDGTVTVDDANAVTLILGAGTNYAVDYPVYRGANPHTAVTGTIDGAVAKGLVALRADHVSDYRGLFDRVQLDVGQKMPEIPTDDLLTSYKNDASTPAASKALESLFFQYGRYLLISSSRPGSLPANLQGVWNKHTEPPWYSDYHVNINVQMNYWLSETTNLSETTEPYLDYIDSLVEPGTVTADEMFGNRGWVVHNASNPFGYTGVGNHPTSFWFPDGAAWLAQDYWEHYRFSSDEEFLRTRAYPVMKAATEFWLDELVTDPRDGKLVVSPSYSPEHGSFTAGGAMSQQIVYGLLSDTLQAAELLDDTAFAEDVETTLGQLDPGIRIGSWGQLQEWKGDWDNPNDEHRHVSQLYALHPGDQINPLENSEYADAAEVSLQARGDAGTGWSKAWKINFWSRLLNGDEAHEQLAQQLKTSTLPNLWDTHPPFQIDGNFGAANGIAEMLLQSQHDVLHVLPALPSAWSDGSVSGLRARGDVTVDVTWAAGAPTRITLHAGQDGPLRVRSDLMAANYQVVDTTTGQRVEITPSGTDEITIDAHAGHRYEIQPPTSR